MTPEESFLQGLQANPADVALRNVYADWLDDRGESSRAAFLRVECEWPLCPVPRNLECRWKHRPFEYPLVLRRLSELAAEIDPTWLAGISLVRSEIVQLIFRFETRAPVEMIPWTGTSEDREKAFASVRAMFEVRLGQPVVRQHFAVPVDYAHFSALMPNGMSCPEEHGMTYFDALYSCERMSHHTIGWCDMYADHATEDVLRTCGMWLFIGNRDKHHYHVCCDLRSPLFGMVADMHDSHPWIGVMHPGPVHGPGESEIHTRCFVDFLRLQVAEAEGTLERPGLWDD
jgi:uncharacterized protein (TIGR02996 family)